MSTNHHPAQLTPEELLDDPATCKADGKAVMDKVINGMPLDPEISRRVSARAEKIRQEILQKHGFLNVAVELVRGGRDEE